MHGPINIRCVYVFCMALRMDSNFALYSTNRSVFVTELESVYCAVRTESLYKTDTCEDRTWSPEHFSLELCVRQFRDNASQNVSEMCEPGRAGEGEMGGGAKCPTIPFEVQSTTASLRENFGQSCTVQSRMHSQNKSSHVSTSTIRQRWTIWEWNFGSQVQSGDGMIYLECTGTSLGSFRKILLFAKKLQNIAKRVSIRNRLKALQ